MSHSSRSADVTSSDAVVQGGLAPDPLAASTSSLLLAPSQGTVPGLPDDTLEAVPSSEFDPSLDDVVPLARGAASSRVTRHQANLRLLLHSTGGFLRYGYQTPQAAGLRTLMPAGTQLRPWATLDDAASAAVRILEDEAAGRDGGRRAVARGYLTIDRSGPIREPGMSPDPLTPFARAMQEVQDGEDATLAVDLRTMSPRQAERWWRSLDPRSGTAGPTLRGNIRSELVRRFEIQTTLPAQNKPTSPGLAFQVQVLIRAEAAERSRARHLAELVGLYPLQALCGPEARVRLHWLGDGWFRPLRQAEREEFARRWAGRFQQTGALRFLEMAGLLVPPTARCEAPNVRREVSLPDPPPEGLDVWNSDRADLFPLGWVQDRTYHWPAGAPLESLLFVYGCGRSRWGKSNLAKLAFRHLVQHRPGRPDEGGAFFDPDQDALEDLMRYFAQEADRVIYVNLSPQNADPVVPGWNIIAVRSAADIPRRVATIKDAFVASAGYDSKRAPRATTLLVMCVQALCEIALEVPPEMAPTLFSILTMLEDKQYRDAVTPHLSPRLRRWWEKQFPNLPDDAVFPITNLIRKLAESPGTQAFFGSSVSTYDIRRAMDEGKIVLVCPAGEGDEETRMLTALLVNDAVRAGLSRRDMPAGDRRWFNLMVDECQEVPAWMIARAVEHFGKFRVRLFAFNQDPARLAEGMRNALMTNCSLILTTAVGWTGAKVMERELGGRLRAETIGNLDRYHFAVLFRPARGQTMGPFGVRAFSMESVWGPGDDQAPARIRAQVEGHRTVDQVRQDLDILDDQIRLYLDTKLHLAAGGGESRPSIPAGPTWVEDPDGDELADEFSDDEGAYDEGDED